MYWRVPVFEEIEVVDVAADVIYPALRGTTKDKKTVHINAVINFEIVDAKASYVNVQDFTDSLYSIAVGHVGERIPELTCDELLEQQYAMKRSLKTTLETKVKDWGAKINDVTLSSVVEAPAFQIIQ